MPFNKLQGDSPARASVEGVTAWAQAEDVCKQQADSAEIVQKSNSKALGRRAAFILSLLHLAILLPKSPPKTHVHWTPVSRLLLSLCEHFIDRAARHPQGHTGGYPAKQL